MKKNQKKIAVISKYFYPVAAGIETNVIETYAVLVERGFDVTVYTTQDTLTEKGVLPLRNEVIRGIKVVRCPTKNFFMTPAFSFDDVGIVALHNSNIVPHFLVMLRTLIAKLLRKKKYILILTPHGGFNPEWSVFPWHQSVLKIFFQYTIGVFLINHAVDGVRAVSEWEKAEMIKKRLDKNKIIVIDNGIEDEAYGNVETEASNEIKTRVSELGDYIIQVGRIYPIKNYETTIKALPLLPVNLNYVIVGPVGDNAYLQELKDLALSLGVSDRVIFFGVVRGSDKYYLIKHARMMVHMALWESFCNVVHEGLSQGLVCVVADNTALPLLVKDNVNGFCLPTKDYKVLAEKISFIEEHWNDAVFVEMRERNREYGLENSWRQVAARMDAFYMRLLTKEQP